MVQSILLYVAAILFAVASVAGVWALRDPVPLRVRTTRGILGAAAAVLVLLLVEAGVRVPLTGLFHSLLGVTFLLAAAGLAADLFFRVPALSWAASLVGVAALLGALVLAPSGARPAPPIVASRWIGLHVACMLVSYAAFALGCLAALLYLFAESNLKRRRRLDLVESLPSLETLDAVEVRAIATGFVLLTLGLVVGYQVRRVETGFATDWRLDPKVVWTGLTWAAYGLVLAARALPVLRGRRAAILAVLGFAFVLVTYLGARTGFHDYDAPPSRPPAPARGS